MPCWGATRAEESSVDAEQRGKEGEKKNACWLLVCWARFSAAMAQAERGIALPRTFAERSAVGRRW
jgi:hypothetical protein